VDRPQDIRISEVASPCRLCPENTINQFWLLPLQSAFTVFLNLFKTLT